MPILWPTFSWAGTPARLAVAALVTVSFALLARVLRGVNGTGALAGALACFLLFAIAGPGAFSALMALFILTWTATHLGLPRKRKLGVAERSEGRNARQVLANLGVAALAAIFFGATGNRAWLIALVAALAEAAVDTVASEIGQARSRTAVLITTWESVPAGTDGGITVHGTIAGAVAGTIIAAVAALAGLIPVPRLWIPALAGFLGMLLDSILGATLQRRAWMNNDLVNFVGTLVAAVLAYAISRA